MTGVTLHDLADDIAAVVRVLGHGSAVLLGHAFGHALARMTATDHPDLVRAVMLAASQASKVLPDIATAPFVVGDPTRPEAERLATLRKAFFAPSHDARPWLAGWYPATLRMQHEAAQAVPPSVLGLRTRIHARSLRCARSFKPSAYWQEFRDQFGERVTSVTIEDASHALFPERPDRVAHAMLPWLADHREAMQARQATVRSGPRSPNEAKL